MVLAYGISVLPENLFVSFAGVAGMQTHWANTTSGHVVFEAVEGCVMPPPQPFIMSIPMNAMKILVITASLGFTPRNLSMRRTEKESWQKRAIYVATTLYGVVMVPVAMVTLIVHFSTVAPGVESTWKAYECFYLFWNLGPYQFNYLLFLVKAICVSVLLESSDVVIKDMPVVPNPVEWAKDLRVTLLEDDEATVTRMHARKLCGNTWCTLVITALPYIVIDIPFAITHKVPAMFIFLPFLIALFLVISVIQWIVYPKMGKLLSTLIRDGPGAALEHFLEIDQSGFLAILPTLFGLNIANEFLTFAPVYLYQGEGWFNSAITVFVERSVKFYGMVFFSKILGHYWSGLNLLNETT